MTDKAKGGGLKTRVITALTLLPIVLVAFIFGPPWFVVLFLLVCITLSVFEIAMMIVPAFERRLAHHGQTYHLDEHGSFGGPIPKEAYIFPGVTIALGWLALLGSAWTDATAGASIGWMALGVITALLIGTFSSRTIDLAAARAFGILVSFCYGVLPWLVAWQLYLMAPHARYILLVMAVTWLGDTGGYFGGRFLGGKVFGERRLAPAISPKKTWEGFFAGILLSIVGALVLNLFFLGELGSASLMVKIGLIGGAAAAVGDLVESTFKRFSGVKDSGFIIPGHGGFLDRIDGILFAAPVIWAILYYFR
jgi:phosphatidate cytidylyltransferase